MPRRVIDGWPTEVERFNTEFRDSVYQYLLNLSWDARSREEAEIAVDDVFSECFGGFSRNPRRKTKGTPVPLLQRYKGFGSLEGWLKRSARNRFYSALRRSEYRQRAADVEPDAEWFDATPSQSVRTGNSLNAPLTSKSAEVQVPAEEQEKIRHAITDAFQSLAEADSQALIFLRLHYIERVKKQRIAEAWQQHAATIGRRINSGLEFLKSEITRRLPDYASDPSQRSSEALILLCRDLLDSYIA